MKKPNLETCMLPLEAESRKDNIMKHVLYTS